MLIVLVGILFYIYQLQRKKTGKEAFVNSVFAIILFSYVVTEIYSSLHLISRNVILVTWICASLLLVGMLFINRKTVIGYYPIIETIKDKNFRKIKICLVLICLGMLLMSACSITANWDSMTYHMPRIMHWIQNKSTAFYATGEVRQITSPPLSEYMMMHVMLLTGGDRFVCLVQGTSYVLSAGLVYAIAVKMKIGKPYTYLAVFLFLMMPPAIAEAVTTQNDLFTTLTMLLFYYYYLDFIYSSDLAVSREKLILASKLGTTIALGYMAKSYVLIPMVILVVYLGIMTILRKEKIKNILAMCGVGIGTAVVGVSPFFIQNYKVYGSLFPKGQTEGIMPATRSVRLLIANCYKNMAQYLSTPLLPGNNDLLMKAGRGIEKIFHIDINDAAISVREFRLPDAAEVYHHDMATNPIIILLCFLVIIGILFKVCVRSKLETGMFLCIVVGLLATCMMSKYSMWKVRYFLSVSAVAIILICFFIERIQEKYRWKECLIGIVLCFSMLCGYGAISYTGNAVRMGYHSNEDGEYTYFVNYQIRGCYNDIENYIKTNGYKSIGLYMRSDSYEYPLWVYLEQVERIEHVMIRDEYLQRLEDLSFEPECIISINRGECDLGAMMEYHGVQYICQCVSTHDSNYGVFVAEDM